jgi:hypothetical protein
MSAHRSEEQAMSAVLSITAFCAVFPLLVLLAPLLLDAVERKLLAPAVAPLAIEDIDGASMH